MNRKDLLSTALSENFNQQTIKSFFEYQISSDDLNFIKEVVVHVLQTIKPKPFDCALLSAMITAVIQDHSNIPVALIGGDFKYKGSSLFKHGAKNLNTEAINENIINGKFDGHFWVEVGDLIIDASIFRTLYSDKIPEVLRKEIELNFGNKKGCIVATAEDMIKEHNFEYIPKYSLSDNTINGLLKGGFFENRLKK